MAYGQVGGVAVGVVVTEDGGVVLGVGKAAFFGELPGGHHPRGGIGDGEHTVGVSDRLACAVIGLGLVEIVNLVVPALRDVVFPFIRERLGEVIVGGIGEDVVKVDPEAGGRSCRGARW